jgi:hypothetical protein
MVRFENFKSFRLNSAKAEEHNKNDTCWIYVYTKKENRISYK